MAAPLRALPPRRRPLALVLTVGLRRRVTEPVRPLLRWCWRRHWRRRHHRGRGLLLVQSPLRHVGRVDDAGEAPRARRRPLRLRRLHELRLLQLLLLLPQVLPHLHLRRRHRSPPVRRLSLLEVLAGHPPADRLLVLVVVLLVLVLRRHPPSNGLRRRLVRLGLVRLVLVRLVLVRRRRLLLVVVRLVALVLVRWLLVGWLLVGWRMALVVTMRRVVHLQLLRLLRLLCHRLLMPLPLLGLALALLA